MGVFGLFRSTCGLFVSAVVVLLSISGGAVAAPPEPVGNRYIVRLKPGVSDAGTVANELAKRYDGRLLAVWKHALQGFWIELPSEKAARLGADARVDRIARDVELEASAEQKTGRRDLPAGLPEVPLRPCYSATDETLNKPDADPFWHLTRLSHRTMAYDADCNPLPAPGESVEDFHSFRYWSDGSWPRGTPTSRVKVYLVDSGVWRAHAEFTGANVTDGFNAGTAPDSPARVPSREPAAVDTSTSVEPCAPDGFPGGTNAAHGTGTASFVVGKYIGVAKGVELVSVKAISCKNDIAEYTLAMLISGLDYVKSVAQPPAVVSLSTFRSVPPSPACNNPGNCAAGLDLQILEDVLHDIIDDGVPVFASANNQGSDACLNTPARLSMRGARRVTGNPPEPIGVITVGGTDRADQRWELSNYGQCVDIFAPAAGLIVAYPPAWSRNPGPFAEQAGLQSGTSYSAPMVASLAARMMAEDLSIWQGRTGPAIVREVWQRLKVNATPLPPAVDPLQSPRLLAYLGGVMFLSQPAPQTVASGSTVALSVSVYNPGGVSYEWYRGSTRVTDGGAYSGAGSATLNITNVDGTTAGEYWVRAIRYENGVKYYADSTRAAVAIGTCPIPEITRQPLSHWDVAPNATVTLRAEVSTTTEVGFEWQRIEVRQNVMTRRLEEHIVQSWSGTTGSGLRQQEVTAPDNIGTTKHVYRLVLTPIGSCGAWRVESDSAQVRTCVPPAPPTLRGPANGVISFSAAGLTTDAAPSNMRIRWYYSATQDGAYEPFRLEDLSANEKAVNGGADWAILRGNRAFPVKPGWYKAAALGACGESGLSDAVQVISGCSFRLKGKYGDAPDEAFVDEKTVDKYAYGARPTLSITTEVDQYDFQPDVQFKWMKGTTQVSTSRSYTVEQITGPVEYVVIATANRAGRTTCERTFTFKLDAKEQPGCPTGTTLAVVAGKCQRTANTILRPYQGSKHVLTATAILNGDEANEELTFKWSTVVDGVETPLPNGEGKGLDAYEYIVSQGSPHAVRVTVTSGACSARSDISIMPLLPACNLCVTPCKRRAVRHNGVEKTLHQFVAGEQGVLSAPDELPGHTYEWHQVVSGGDDVVMGTTGSIEVTFEHTSDFYVITNTGAEREVSDNFKAVLDNRTSSEAEATPSFHAVQAGQTATFTASLTSTPEDATTRYEWRQASTYGDWHPVIHEGKTLTVTANDDTVYWCRILKDDPATGQQQYWDTNFVSLVVFCTDSIAGGISANTSQVARDQRPRLTAFAAGKNVNYFWDRTLPDDPTPVPVSTSGSGVVYPIVTDPVTYFHATATDACGQTADLGQVAIYLCVPTIDVPPQNKLERPDTPATLTVAATPAIAGQTFTVKWFRASDVYQQTPLGEGTSFTTTLSPGTSDSFYAALTSDCGGSPHTIKSAAATIEYCANPVIHSYTQTDYITSPGGWAQLSIAATGKELTYQWYRGNAGDTSTPLTGKTESFLDIAPNTTTHYWCRIKSQNLCTTDTGTAVVEVCRTPTIVTGPQGDRIFSGKTALLSVVADAGENTDPLIYQWQRENAPGEWMDITGANAATYTTPALTADTNYRVKISAGICEIVSDPAAIAMCALPESVSGSDYKVELNGSVTLSLPVMSPVVSKNVVWYRGEAGDVSAPVRSGVNVSYTTPQLTATTRYWAEFEYETCVSRTTTYTVTVCKPNITTPPANATIPSGSSASLTIVTTNIPGQTIQWYRGPLGDTSNPIGGATAATYITPALTTTTTYWVRVSSCGYNADAAATVTVCTPPQPTLVTPSPHSIQSGQTVSLQTYAPGSNITYQWYLGTSGVTTHPISGQTTDWLQVSPATNTSYWCKVTSYGTCVTNGPTITVDVCNAPVIDVQPVSTRSFAGAATTLSVSASSSRPLTYQWYRGSAGDTANPIGAATSSPSVTVSPTTETSYWVRVINGVCSTDSAAATVSICTFQPSYSGSEIRIAYNTTATLSLPTMSPVVSKNVWWYRGAAGDKTTLVSSGVNASYTTPALTATTTYWAEFEYEGCYSRTTAYTVNVCRPTITTQPANKSIVSGQSTTLSIATTPIAGQTIQWYIGAAGTTTSPVSGGTGTSITVSPTTTTTYWVRVSSCGFTADSAAATVSVCTAPTINIVTPSPRYIRSGTTTSLQTYSSSANLTYQWYVGASGTMTSPISGQTSDWYQASPASTTSYWCRVTSNGTCVTNGPTITVDVCNLPAISAQPQSQRIFSGRSTTLSVTASSPTHVLSYQWYIGTAGDTSTPISGATSSSVTVAPTTETGYWVRVTTSGGACTVDSATATLWMCTYPEVVPGGSYDIASGQSATLNLPAMSPVDNKNVVWYQGPVGVRTTPVRSGVNVSYTTPALTTATQYWAEFEHYGCYSRTETYTVNVCKPTITAQPQSQTIFSGNTATLSVTATGAPLSYQWYRGSTGDTSQPVGTNASSYTTTALTSGASYWVRVTGCTVADSATATVQVCTAPTIGSISKDPWTSIGGTGSITVSASGTSLTYQWYEGLSGDTTNPIAGATSATYTFVRQTSKYLWVRVSSGCNGAYVNSVATMYSVDAKITSEPQDLPIVPTGTAATFSVTASGTYLSYQWYSDTAGLIPGATSATYTTPPLTATSSYYVKVTSGTTGHDYSRWAHAFVCQGPGISSVTSTQINATTWQLTANINSWEAADTRYFWYKGPVGNVAASVYQGEAGNVFYAYNVVSSTTYWVRAMWVDETCYTDRGKTVP